MEIGPHPELSESQKRIIALDYGMRGGRAQIHVRKALRYYALRRLGLDIDPDARKPQDQQIVLSDGISGRAGTNRTMLRGESDAWPESKTGIQGSAPQRDGDRAFERGEHWRDAGIAAQDFLEITYPTHDLLKGIEAVGPDQGRPVVVIGERGLGKST